MERRRAIPWGLLLSACVSAETASPPIETPRSVVLDRGAPSGGATIERFRFADAEALRLGRPLARDVTTSDPEGAFAFPASAGPAVLVARAGRKVATAVATEAPLTLTLFPGAELTGRVLTADGRPAGTATVAISSGCAFRAAARPGPDGRFALVVEPGELEVVAHAPGYGPARATTLPSAERPAEVELVLEAEVTLVAELRTSTGAPIRGVAVSAIGADGEARSVRSRRGGALRIDGLAPRRVELEIHGLGHVPRLAVDDPAAGGVLRLPPLHPVEVRGPGEGRVTLAPLGHPATGEVVGRLVGGRAHLRAAAGPYLVRLDGQGVEDVVRLPTARPLVLAPPAAGEVVVRVVDGHGRPRRGVRVARGERAVVTDRSGLARLSGAGAAEVVAASARRPVTPGTAVVLVLDEATRADARPPAR